jgi:DNA-binding MarR family transcriptional regulator
MIDSGHLRRDCDPADRRKVILRYAEHGRETAGAFFTPLAAHTHAAMAEVSDADLSSAHRYSPR